MRILGVFFLFVSAVLFSAAQVGSSFAFDRPAWTGVGQPHQSLQAQKRHSAQDSTVSPQSSSEGIIAEPLNATLQLPDSAFAPGIVDEHSNRPESNVLADQDFGFFHAARDGSACLYECMHRKDSQGWFQKATFGPLTFGYMGSLFASSAAAQQALRAGLEHNSINDTPSNCGNIYHVPCYTMEFDSVATPDVTSGSSTSAQPGPTPTALQRQRFMYTILQYNECMVETTVQARSDIFEVKRDVLLPTLAAIVKAGYVHAQQVCPHRQASALDFSIVQVRAEKQLETAAFNLSHPGMQSAQINKPVNLAIYFYVRSLIPRSIAVAEFTVQRGLGVHFFFQSHGLHLDKAPDTYRITVPYVPRYLGNDLILGRISVNGLSLQSATSLRVVKRYNTVNVSRPPAATVPTHKVSPPAPKPQATPAPPVPGRPSDGPRLPTASAFAMTASAFPPHSDIRVSQVESNDAAGTTPVPHLARESFSQEGRLTGYYMDTVQANNGHAVYTEYLVSIFRTRAQADTAFSTQMTAYSRLEHAYPTKYYALGAPVRLGDRLGVGVALTKLQKHIFETSELYFVRGRILVQIVQGYFAADARSYGSKAGAYVLPLAGRIDALARANQ